MLEFYLKLKNGELGQDAAEYALVIGLVSLVALVTAMTLGTNLATWYTQLANYVGGLTLPGAT